MSYLRVQDQQSMALDEYRNVAYLAALEKVITPESVVLDLGCGLGVHGLLAAKLGAKKVYFVEPEDVISVAEAIAVANGFRDRVECWQGKIEDVTLPEKVDVILSVFTGNMLLNEDLLPSLFYARDRYLKPGGTMIPEAAVLEAVPVSASELYAESIAVWSKPHLGLDHSPARAYCSQSIFYYHDKLRDVQYLAEPAKLLSMNFYTQTDTACDAAVDLTITTAGTVHGWASWFNMLIGDTWVSTAPHAPKIHWSAGFLPIDPPIDVTLGEVLSFRLQRPPKGEWIWTTKTTQSQQQRSTFFATPMTLKTLKRNSPNYQPQLNPKGKAAQYVLNYSDGSRSVAQLSQEIMQHYGELFPTLQAATTFVQGLVNHFS